MSNKRVLVIDDDAEIRRSIRQGLSPAGWDVESAADGMTGLEMIRRASAEGSGFRCIVTEAFLSDLDGKLLLWTLRAQYPEVPLIVLTAYGDEEREAMVMELKPAAYFDKPLDIDAIVEKINEFESEEWTHRPVPPPEVDLEVPELEAYLMIRLVTREKAGEIYDKLRNMYGVKIANAVRGEYDIILRVSGPSKEVLDGIVQNIVHTDGLEVCAQEFIESPRLSPDIDEFVRHYKAIAREHQQNYVVMGDTNAYLLVDIDRYRVERIYTSVLMTEGVIHCSVTKGGNRLVVLMSGAVRPGVVRHLLRKLAEMDGILRVREATVINVND